MTHMYEYNDDKIRMFISSNRFLRFRVSERAAVIEDLQFGAFILTLQKHYFT